MENKENKNGNESLISVEDVKKSFPVGDGEVTILKGISFDIKPGEFVSIVGPSGNGKSTLLNMITGIDRPTSGEVLVTGKRLNKLRLEKRESLRMILMMVMDLFILSALYACRPNNKSLHFWDRPIYHIIHNPL